MTGARAETMTGSTQRTAVVIPDSQLAESTTADAFKAAFRLHPAGVAVVTADPGDGPVAMTVSSLSSVSAEPPMLVFSVSALSSSAPALERAETVVIHMVGSDQLWLAKLGATSGIDRFEDESVWTRLPTGEPVFPESDQQVDDPTTPLVYHARAWYRLGDHSAISP